MISLNMGSFVTSNLFLAIGENILELEKFRIKVIFSKVKAKVRRAKSCKKHESLSLQLLNNTWI